MRHYKLGSQAYYADGVHTPAGEVVALPDHILPSHTWQGLDGPSKAAVAVAKDLHMKKTRQLPYEIPAQFMKQEEPKEALVEKPLPPPETVAELNERQGKAKRTSDKLAL